MKRIIAAVVLIAISVGASGAVCFKVQKNCDKMTQLMTLDRELIIQNEATDYQRANEIMTEWESMEKFMAAFLPHSEIDSVEIGIRCLQDYDEQGLPDEYLETLNECINTLNHVKESEKPIFKNIF